MIIWTKYPLNEHQKMYIKNEYQESLNTSVNRLYLEFNIGSKLNRGYIKSSQSSYRIYHCDLMGV